MVARSNPCSDKEADNAPGYTALEFGKGRISPRVERPPFHDILDADMVKSALDEEGVRFDERLYTPLVTLCVFLSQVLGPDHSCRAAVARLIVWLAINRRRTCAAETNSYCEARQRLPLGVVVRLTRQTAREIEGRALDAWLWNGRRGVAARLDHPGLNMIAPGAAWGIAMSHAHVVTRWLMFMSESYRGSLVERVEGWRWCSLHWRRRSTAKGNSWLSAWPVERPRRWLTLVNTAQTEAELATLQHSIARGCPFGETSWSDRTARRLGLEMMLRPPGRPRKQRIGSDTFSPLSPASMPVRF